MALTQQNTTFYLNSTNVLLFVVFSGYTKNNLYQTLCSVISATVKKTQPSLASPFQFKFRKKDFPFP